MTKPKFDKAQVKTVREFLPWNTPPKKKRAKREKPKASFKDQIRALRSVGNKAALDTDLRKNVTPQKLAATKRNYDTIKSIRNYDMIIPPRKKGETLKHHNERIRRFKANRGQGHTAAKGVLINMVKRTNRHGYKPEYEYNYFTDDIVITTTVNSEDGKEVIEKHRIFIPIDRDEFVGPNRREYLQSVMDEIPNDFMANGKRRKVRIKTEHFANVSQDVWFKNHPEAFINEICARADRYERPNKDDDPTISGFEVEIPMIFVKRGDKLVRCEETPIYD